MINSHGVLSHGTMVMVPLLILIGRDTGIVVAGHGMLRRPCDIRRTQGRLNLAFGALGHFRTNRETRMRVLLLVFLMAAVTTAAGQVEVNCSSSERFGGKIIKVGDSERRVIEAGPDREVRLETQQGGAAGFRFDFYKYGRTVQIYVQAGVVTRICRLRD